MIYGFNMFYLYTAWAIFCVLAAAMIFGNGFPSWGISLWWVPVLALIGLGPITGLILWMMLVMTAK